MFNCSTKHDDCSPPEPDGYTGRTISREQEFYSPLSRTKSKTKRDRVEAEGEREEREEDREEEERRSGR